MPAAWARGAFLEFFRKSGDGNPSPDDFEMLAALFRAAEAAFGPMPMDVAIRRTAGKSRLEAQKVLRVNWRPYGAIWLAA
jgi:hypothetical protein